MQIRWKIVMELSIKRHAYNITGHSCVYTLTWIWSGFGFLVSLSSVSYEKIYKYNTTIANRMSKLKQSPNRRVNKLVVSLIYCNVLCVFDSIIFSSCFSQLLSHQSMIRARTKNTLFFCKVCIVTSCGFGLSLSIFYVERHTAFITQYLPPKCIYLKFNP